MAERGDVTSIKDGSDFDSEVVCTPCGEDNIRAEAIKYCPDCQESLCATCTFHHGRLKATRSHKVIDKNPARQASVIAMTTKCLYHPDRDIEMYCGTHDMVYCTKCIATEHRACSGVTGIEEMKTSFVKKEVERLQNDTRKIQERLADTDKKTKKNIDCIEEQRDGIITKVEDVEKSLIEHIRKLKCEALETVNKDYTSSIEELKSDITLITNMKKEIENARSKFQTFTSMDVGQRFVQMKLIQKTVNDAEKLVEDSEAKGSKALCFTENTDLKTTIIAATSLGHMNTCAENDRQNVQRVYKVKSKKEINTKMKNDRAMSRISDICQLQDGTIILADCDNRKIKRLDMNYNIKDHCNLGTYPSGICCTGQNEVAVLIIGKVQFISVGRLLSKLRYISIMESGCDWGMACCAGELWISTRSGVNVYSAAGRLQSIRNDRDIFKSEIKRMAVSGETVIITDDSDGAVCLGRDYTVQRELRDERLVDTRGVCVSSDGTVFLSGYSSHNIVMFDKNGQCLGELVAKDASLNSLIALKYDDKRNCLIAATDGYFDNLIVINISA